MVESIIELAQNNRLDGIYSDIPHDVYNDPRFPAIRSSHLKEIARSSYFKFKNKNSTSNEALEFGTLFHTAMEGKSFDAGADQSKIVVMRNNTLTHPKLSGLIDSGKKEYTFIMKQDDVYLRCRPDLWVPEMNLIIDYKTTFDASPDAFAIAAKKYRMKFAASYYMKIVSELSGERVDQFWLVAVEKSGKHHVAIYAYYREDCAETFEEIDRAIELYKKGVSGEWDGYSQEIKRLRY
jgi:hypothetical protein